MIADYKLFNLPRREVMQMQIEMPYRAYVAYKVDKLEHEYSKYIEANWKDRTQEQVDMMTAYTKAIDVTEKLLKSMRDSSNNYKGEYDVREV